VCVGSVLRYRSSIRLTVSSGPLALYEECVEGVSMGETRRGGQGKHPPLILQLTPAFKWGGGGEGGEKKKKEMSERE